MDECSFLNFQDYKYMDSGHSEIVNRLLVICLTLLLCIGILETGLRVIGRTPSNLTEGIYEQYHDSFRLKKNMTKTTKIPAYTYSIHTNAFGFRDKSTGERDIIHHDYCVFLGASEVFANGVDFENTFVGIFDNHASKHGIEVLNMATGGHYFLDQEDLFKEFIHDRSRKPIRLLFCVNDLHIPKFDLKNTHLRVINGYVFPEKGWLLPFIRLTLGNLSSSYCYFRDGIRTIQAKWFNFKTSNDSPEFIELYSNKNRMRNPETWQKFEEYLDNLHSYCQSQNVELIFIYLPIIDSYNLDEYIKQYDMDPDDFDTSFYDDSMRAYCQKRNLRYITCQSMLKQLFDEGKKLRFQLDPHYNEYANRVIGEYLAGRLFETKQ